MEQMYLIEIFIDKIAVFVPEDEEFKKEGAVRKGLITKVRFGPNTQFIFKEEQLAANSFEPDEFVENDEDGRKKWVRTVKVGQSYLFPSYPDTVFGILYRYPLEFELWTDDLDEENNIFIGVGYMEWETQFFMKLRESAEACKPHDPLSIKKRTILTQECCCKAAAEVEFILRLSPLGESVITDFQQPLHDPDTFIFRTNKAPSSFSCKRVEVDDAKYVMKGSLYQTAITDDPTLLGTVQKKLEVCTELQSCGMKLQEIDYRCEKHKREGQTDKEYPVDKVAMGEISGPCGNTFCPLAHKIRAYIRNLDGYKQNAHDVQGSTKKTRKICGACDCKEDRYHREDTATRKPGENAPCSGCRGTIRPEFSCKEVEDKLAKACTALHGNADKGGKQTIAYVFSVHKVPDFKESMFGKDSVGQSLNVTYNDYLTAGASSVKSDGRCSCRAVKESTEDSKQTLEFNPYLKSSFSCLNIGGGCCCRPMPNMDVAQETFNSASTPNLLSPEFRPSTCRMCANNQFIYNVTEVKQSNKHWLEITDDEDYKCRKLNPYLKSSISCLNIGGGCCCRPMPNMDAAQETQVFDSASTPNLWSPENRPSACRMCANNQLIYNVTEVKQSNKHSLEITDDKDCKFRDINSYLNSGISCVKTGGGCCCRPMPNMNAAPANIPNPGLPEYRPSTRSMGANNPLIYNVSEVKSNKYCLEITDDKDCKCSPKKPAPPCKTFDCDCLQETVNIASRKKHRPYCPLFKHKTACPVNTMFDDEEKVEEDEDAVEPLPYGLPPIKLGPCPVMGRPCSVPDGFARMYKNAALPRPPPSQGVAGKVCCSQEYERIKTAIKEYMKGQKDHDLRCVNVFNIDTEKRCCDKDQALLALMGKTCCGTHKLALQDKFKEGPSKK